MPRRKGKASPQTWRKACVQGEWWRDEQCKRADIDRLQIHDTEIMIGGKHRRQYAPYVEEVLEDNFTPKEIAHVKNLYVETNPKFLGEGVSASNEQFNPEGREDASIIRVPRSNQGRDVVGGEETITHETIHALRNVMGRYVEDVDKDESTTELETICRISRDGMHKAATGYYQFIPGLKTNDEFFDAQDQDRLLLNVEYEHKRKGDDAIRTTETKYPESNISKIDLSGTVAATGGNPESLDRYFLIKTKGKTIRLHERDADGIVPPLRQTKKRLKKRYGEDATIFEWKDGEKVNISKDHSYVGSKKRYAKSAQKHNIIGSMPLKTTGKKKKHKKTASKRKATKKKTSQKRTYPSIL